MRDLMRGKVTGRDWAFVGAVLGVTGLLAVAFYFLFYGPQQTKLAQVRRDIQEQRQELKKAIETQQNIDKLREDSAKMEQLVQLFEQRLPEEREIPSLLRQFERLGDDLGLSVELKTLPTTSDANKETIPYEVTALGNFHQIVSFINLLERDERYLKVSDLDIQEEEAGLSEATFTLSTFRFIQSAASETP